MNSVRSYLMIVFLLNTIPVSSQSWEEVSLEVFSNAILEVENRVPEESSYGFRADYFFFEQLESIDTTLILHTSLSYHHSNNLLNLDQFGRWTIQTSNLQLTCDTTYKQIILNDPSEEFTHRKGMEDFKQFLNSECKVQVKEEGEQKVYSIVFADGARYRGAEIWIENEGMVNKYVLYAGVPVLDDSQKEDKLIQPRLEVHFRDYVFGDELNMVGQKKIEDYFINIEELELQEEYSSYEVIDLRTTEDK